MALKACVPDNSAVSMTDARAANAFAPHSERKQPITFRWMTEGRNARSATLLVGSTSLRYKNTNSLSRCLRYRFASASHRVGRGFFGAAGRSGVQFVRPGRQTGQEIDGRVGDGDEWRNGTRPASPVARSGLDAHPPLPAKLRS